MNTVFFLISATVNLVEAFLSASRDVFFSNEMEKWEIRRAFAHLEMQMCTISQNRLLNGSYQSVGPASRGDIFILDELRKSFQRLLSKKEESNKDPICNNTIEIGEKQKTAQSVDWQWSDVEDASCTIFDDLIDDSYADMRNIIFAQGQRTKGDKAKT